MDFLSNKPAFWCYAIACILFSGLALYAFALRSRGAGQWLHIATSVTSALWAAQAAWQAYRSSVGLLEWHWRLDILRLMTWLFFALVLLRLRSAHDVKRMHPVLAGRSVAFSIFVAAMVTFLLPPSEQALAGFYLALGLSIGGLVLTEQFIAQAGTPRWWVIKPFVLGLGALFFFDLVYYSSGVLFREPDPYLWSARGVIHAISALVIAVSAARSHGWRDELQLSHVAAFRVTSIVLAGAYLVFISIGGYWVAHFGGDWGGTLKVAFLFAAILGLAGVTLSGQWRAALRVSIAKNLFTYRYDYRTEWLRFTEQLASRSLGDTEHQRMIRAMAALVESPGGQLWVRTDREFQLIDVLEAPQVDAMQPVESSLVRFFSKTRWVIDIDAARRRGSRYAELELPHWLHEYSDAWLLVPLATANELTGFMVLHRSLVRVDLNWEVLDILKMAGTQLAVHLSETRAKAQLMEAERFDAFNRMSAYVVHDLKNLVAQLDLLVRNAERHKDNPEFQADMLETVQHAVSRMQQLMLQLRSGSIPADPPKRLELSALVQRIVDGKSAIGATIETAIDPSISVAGHYDRLERVTGHLIQNAMEASPTLSTKIGVRLVASESWAVLEVSDSGIGMSEAFIREKLFHPFQTTKSNGMGIGMYESAQYLKSIGGKIDVRSVPFAGTTFRVELPLLATGHDPA